MESQAVPTRSAVFGIAEARVNVFVCANCVRAGVEPSARFRRPTPPAFPWTCTVEEVVVPCAGRLQPEHVLRAVEAGADLVCIIGCEEDNCHFLEGSCRAGRRVRYIQQLLEDVGMDSRRLMMFHLPGSAREDMAVGAPQAAQAVKSVSSEERSRQVASIAAQVAERLGLLSPNPLREPRKADEEVSEVDDTEENDE